MRKTYGNTWWGKQWLNALTHIDNSNRLPRGRTYANKGAARDIEIKGNSVTAKVQGSRSRPYNIDISIPNFTTTEKATIIDIVTSNPSYLSKLLNRVLPNDLNDACSRKGVELFPKRWRDVNGSCSCPDSAVPCKHLAAVLYLIANEIDKNPFLVFQLHGFDLFQGLEAAGYTASGQQEIMILSAESLRVKTRFEEAPFEWSTEQYAALDFSTIPECQEQLLTLLGEQSVFYPSGNFKAICRLVYRGVTKNVQKLIKKKSGEELTAEMDAVEEVALFLDEDLDFKKATFKDSRGKTVLSFDKAAALIAWLDSIPPSRIEQLSNTLRGLFLTYHLAEKLVLQSAYIPQLLRLGTKHYKIRWLAATLNESVRAIYEAIKSLCPTTILYYQAGAAIHHPTESDYFPNLLSFFLNHFVHTHHPLNSKHQAHSINRLFFDGSVESFNEFESRAYPSAIQLWLSTYYIVEKDHVPVLQIEDLEDRFEVQVAIDDTTKPIEPPISLQTLFTQKAFAAIRLDVLRDLAMLSDYFPKINKLLASKGKEKLSFNSDEFVDILFKILPTIRLFGIKVLLPKALRKLLRPQMSMLLEGGDTGVVKKTSIISMENMLRFKWRIALGDKLLTEDEFLELVTNYSGIVKLNDEYVFFDQKEIESLIDKIANPPTLDSHQLLQFALTEDYKGAKVHLDRNIRKLIDDLLKQEPVKPPKGLKATLRPYQQRGYQWLYKNSRLGFGSLLADDMGLGKTLQVITTLLKLKQDGEFDKHKGLIVVPTTLLTNWSKEINKFAPELKTHIYHGTNRSLEPLAEADLLITTYGVARSETTKLNKQKWLTLVIDESQNIKNPTTAQTKAIKKIKAPVKIAMSGTPVENRLSDYWSVFDFSNKGYLGSLKKFKENFAYPIEIDKDKRQLRIFRKVTEPFILRRLKSDKTIIKDLPDKIEKDQYCKLTPEQTALYQSVVDTTMKSVESAEGIARKGQILKLITALKQVCNHPKQFLKKGKSDPALSGKCGLLFDLLRQLLDNGEKALIFTQYKTMGKILVELLADEFGLEVPFLYGGVSRKKRDEMVEDFQNNRTTRVMILSLKAGGTGLNLTAASNVIHYDLWWNPAVEAQATDRAYRIGQTRNVMVHRFITQGTFEEKINKLIQEKKNLASMAVATGEKWIGDLSNSELSELMRLEG